MLLTDFSSAQAREFEDFIPGFGRDDLMVIFQMHCNRTERVCRYIELISSCKGTTAYYDTFSISQSLTNIEFCT